MKGWGALLRALPCACFQRINSTVAPYKPVFKRTITLIGHLRKKRGKGEPPYRPRLRH
jgi:hypothetical protein